MYDDEANGTAPRLFAGSRAVALELSKRDWDLAFRSERETAMPIVRLTKGGGVKDPALLSRGQGALLGHLVGSALGSAHRPLVNHRHAAGQIGSAGEITIACARSILDLGSDHKSLRAAYAAWANSSPLEPDRALDAAAARQPLADNLSTTALSRLTPLTLWGHAADPSLLVAKIRADTGLTHPAPVAADAAAVLAIALHSLLQGTSAPGAIESAHDFARRSGCAPSVIEAVAGSHDRVSATRVAVDAPDVTTALHAILFHLAKTDSFEDAVAQAIALSPASDALPALVGAFIGARLGREGIPERLRAQVLSCRPMEGLSMSARPATYWATDAMTMAEALLTAR